GFVDAARESPPAGKPMVPVDLPDLGNGPHFFYGLQWWFFGLLAVFGFCYLAYDERRRLARGEEPGSFRPAERRTQAKESAGRWRRRGRGSATGPRTTARRRWTRRRRARDRSLDRVVARP